MRVLAFCFIALLAGCGSRTAAPVQDLSGREDLSLFKLAAVRGARDGDRLNTQALFTDSSSFLNLEMQFVIGSPTTLQSGTWRWSRNNRLATGAVTAQWVTFLGGQDGPPSIGGGFTLLDSANTPRYRVSIPVTPLRK